MNIVRRWWPVPVLLAVSIIVQKAFVESRYDVSGHAAEHLQGATVVFPAFVIIAVLLYATPGARRQPLVLGACAMWLLSTVLVLRRQHSGRRHARRRRTRRCIDIATRDDRGARIGARRWRTGHHGWGY